MHSNHTIYVNLMGRIGNNLFQVATAMSLAKRMRAKVVAVPNPYYVLPPPDEGKSLYDYLQPYMSTFLQNIEIANELPDNVFIYKEPSFSFHELPFTDRLYLYGYFQSEKYFDIPYIRKSFSISKKLKESLVYRYGHLLQKNPVSVNVRRGDYLLLQNQHPVCSVDYYFKCMEEIGKRRCYIVTSDDIQWCRQNFVGDNYHIIDNITPLENLYLQSLCRDHIISNSTFSWWGAWLDPNPEKIVLAPLRWFGTELSYIDTKDLLPNNWICI